MEYMDTQQVAGEITLTSNRVIFTSATKNFEFKPSRIVDVELYSDGVQIQTTSTRGTGAYLLESPELFEAVLEGLLRKHKYLTNNLSCSQSRHIPDDVKREVWHRDGGRCVQCDATEYLEFDHIIPHSKGGANTVSNIQLLCRNCNNLKRDRI